MSKYTKEDVINFRKCGIKYWDEAVSLVGRDCVIENALTINNKYPNIWGAGWSNLEWAFGNAVIESVNRGQISQTWNLDEALTQDEMNMLMNKYKLEPYKPMRTRKTLKVNKLR